MHGRLRNTFLKHTNREIESELSSQCYGSSTKNNNAIEASGKMCGVYGQGDITGTKLVCKELIWRNLVE